VSRRKYEARGTAFDPYLSAPRALEIRNKAVRTMLGSKEGRYRSEVEAAQDVLDLLYTGMLFGLFKDYKPEPSTRIEFP
jgi:hypothetical protein